MSTQNVQILEEQLLDILRQCGERVILSFSGGVDSTLLLYAAQRVLPHENFLAVTAVSSLRPQHDTALACKIAADIGVNHRAMQTGELSDPIIRMNPPNRCYLCKLRLMHSLKAIADNEGYDSIIEGSNTDDLTDDRPGLQVLLELDIKSPYLVINFGKNEIRALSRHWNVPSWERPPESCLATRFPFGTLLDATILNRVECAELEIRQLGFNLIRLRVKTPTIVIETAADELAKLESCRAQIVSIIQQQQLVDNADNVILKCYHT